MQTRRCLGRKVRASAKLVISGRQLLISRCRSEQDAAQAIAWGAGCGRCSVGGSPGTDRCPNAGPGFPCPDVDPCWLVEDAALLHCGHHVNRSPESAPYSFERSVLHADSSDTRAAALVPEQVTESPDVQLFVRPLAAQQPPVKPAGSGQQQPAARGQQGSSPDASKESSACGALTEACGRQSARTRAQARTHDQERPPPCPLPHLLAVHSSAHRLSLP